MTRVSIIAGDRLKTDDTEPNLVVQLIKDNQNPVDLSTGTPTVNLYIAEANSDDLTVDADTSGDVSITDAANGEITYSWQAGDTSTAGTYIAEVEVVDGSDVATYPNRGTFNIHVEEGLN